MRIVRRVYVPCALKSLTTFIIVVHLEVTCCFYLFYKWLRAIVFLLCAYAWLFLVSNFTSLLFNELFPPFYSSILKPDFHLSFRQSQLLGKIKPLSSDHILLACELSFQALQLLHGKDGAHAFRLFDGPICFVPAAEQSSCNNGKGPSENVVIFCQ